MSQAPLPRLTLPLPPAAPGVGGVPGADPSSGIGEGAQRLGRQVAELGQRMEASRRQRELEAFGITATDAAAKAADLAMQAPPGQEFATFEVNMAAINEQADAIEDPRVREGARQFVRRKQLEGQRLVRRESVTREKNESARSFAVMVDAGSRQIMREGASAAPEVLAELERAIDGRVATGMLDPNEGELLKAQTRQGVKTTEANAIKGEIVSLREQYAEAMANADSKELRAQLKEDFEKQIDALVQREVVTRAEAASLSISVNERALTLENRWTAEQRQLASDLVSRLQAAVQDPVGDYAEVRDEVMARLEAELPEGDSKDLFRARMETLANVRRQSDLTEAARLKKQSDDSIAGDYASIIRTGMAFISTIENQTDPIGTFEKWYERIYNTPPGTPGRGEAIARAQAIRNSYLSSVRGSSEVIEAFRSGQPLEAPVDPRVMNEVYREMVIRQNGDPAQFAKMLGERQMDLPPMLVSTIKEYFSGDAPNVARGAQILSAYESNNKRGAWSLVRELGDAAEIAMTVPNELDPNNQRFDARLMRNASIGARLLNGQSVLDRGAGEPTDLIAEFGVSGMTAVQYMDAKAAYKFGVALAYNEGVVKSSDLDDAGIRMAKALLERRYQRVQGNDGRFRFVSVNVDVTEQLRQSWQRFRQQTIAPEFTVGGTAPRPVTGAFREINVEGSFEMGGAIYTPAIDSIGPTSFMRHVDGEEMTVVSSTDERFAGLLTAYNEVNDISQAVPQPHLLWDATMGDVPLSTFPEKSARIMDLGIAAYARAFGEPTTEAEKEEAKRHARRLARNVYRWRRLD